MPNLDFSRLTVLIADDSGMMRQLLTVILHSLGVRQIIIAEDGPSAARRLAESSPDVILLDILMPGMDGITFCRKVREGKMKVQPFIPIIVVSGYSDLGHIQAARDAGANDFLTKPLTVKALYAKLSALVSQPRFFVRAQDFVGPDRRRRRERRHDSGDRTANDRRASERRKIQAEVLET